MGFQILILYPIVFLTISSTSQAKDLHPAVPYQYGFHTQTDHGTNFRKEEGDGRGTVRGSYGYTDPSGTYREVHYIADHLGFRAEIKTNERGTAGDNPAHIRFHSSDTKPEVQKPVFQVPGSELRYNAEGSGRSDKRSPVVQESTKSVPLPLELARKRGDHGGHE